MRKNPTLLLIFLISLKSIVFGQVNFTSLAPTHSENFNSLPNTGASATWTDNSTLANWYSSKTTIYISDGIGTVGGLYSFGPTANSDRALGALGTSTSGTFYNAIKLKNNDATLDILSLDINFTGEQWREGATATVLEFEYQIANPLVISDANAPTTGWVAYTPLNFASIANSTAQALDGNLSSNQTLKTSNLNLTTTPVAPGQEIWLRWKITGGSGKCGLAIDNLNLAANYFSTCTAPTVGISNLQLTPINPNSIELSYTIGDGIGRTIIGKENTMPINPEQLDDYSSFDNTTWNTIPSNETPPIGSNQYALYDGIGDVVVSGALTPETKYCYKVFEYLGSHCYNQVPDSSCIFTTSLEPTQNTTTLTANVISATQIDLNFTSMAAVGLPSTKHGYIILQKINTTPTEIPLDGNGYNIGDAIGTAKVAAIITNPSDIATSITGLLSSTQYCFTIFSYRWNGTDSGTINYLTPAVVPSTCGLLLPVELLSFGGSCQDNNTIQLNWTTASEKNSNFFIVEKSNNGIDFYGIDSVAASGNSNTIKNYNCVDKDISNKINYYRLKEFDTNNNEYVYKIVQINCEINLVINSYFDDVNNLINIELNNEIYNAHSITISLNDISGKLILEEKKQLNSFKNKISLPIKQKLSKGIYLLSINNGGSVFTKKIFIY